MEKKSKIIFTRIFHTIATFEFYYINNGTADVQQQDGSNYNSQKNFPENFKAGRGGKPGFPDGERGMMEGKGKGSASIPNLLGSNLSIIGVFTVITYYIEMLLLRKRAV